MSWCKNGHTERLSEGFALEGIFSWETAKPCAVMKTQILMVVFNETFTCRFFHYMLTALRTLHFYTSLINFPVLRFIQLDPICRKKDPCCTESPHLQKSFLVIISSPQEPSDFTSQLITHLTTSLQHAFGTRQSATGVMQNAWQEEQGNKRSFRAFSHHPGYSAPPYSSSQPNSQGYAGTESAVGICLTL